MKGLMIRTEPRKCGDLVFHIDCNACGKRDSYPMAGWDLVEDTFWICLDCIEEVGFTLHHYEKPEENEE